MFQTKNGTLPLVSLYAMVEYDILDRNLFKDAYDKKEKTPREMYVYVHRSQCMLAGIHVPPNMPMTAAERKFYAESFDAVSQVLGYAFELRNPFRIKALSKRQIEDEEVVNIDGNNNPDQQPGFLHGAIRGESPLMFPQPDNPVKVVANYVFVFMAGVWNWLVRISLDLPKMRNYFIVAIIFGAISDVFVPTKQLYLSIVRFHTADHDTAATEREAYGEGIVNVTSSIKEITQKVEELLNETERLTNDTNANHSDLETALYDLKELNNTVNEILTLQPRPRRPTIQTRVYTKEHVIMAEFVDPGYTIPFRTKATEKEVVYLNFIAKGILLQGDYNIHQRYVLTQSHDNLLMEVFLHFPDHSHDPEHSCLKFFSSTTEKQKNYTETHGTAGQFLQFTHWYDFKVVESFRKTHLSAFQRCSCTCNQEHAFSNIANLERCMCISDSFYGLARFITELKGHIESFPFPDVLEPHANTHNNLFEMYSTDLNKDMIPSENSKIALTAGINAALNQQYLSCDTAEFDIECKTEVAFQWIASRLASHEFLMSNSSTALKENIQYQRLYKTYESAGKHVYNRNEKPHEIDIRKMMDELRLPPEYVPLEPRLHKSSRIIPSGTSENYIPIDD